MVKLFHSKKAKGKKGSWIILSPIYSLSICREVT